MTIEQPWSGFGPKIDDKIRDVVADVFDAWEISGRRESADELAGLIEAISIYDLEEYELIELADDYYRRVGGLESSTKKMGLRYAIEAGAIMRCYELAVDQVNVVASTIISFRDGVSQ